MLRIAFACLFLCAFLIGTSPAQPGDVPLDETGFTRYMAKLTQKAHPDGEVTIAGPLHLRVQQNGKTWHSYLWNIYSFCQRNPDICRSVADLHVRELAADHASDHTPEASALRIVVRRTAYVEQIARNLADQGAPVAERIAGDLWMIAVFDRPTTVAIVKPNDLELLHLSTREALARGKENTKAEIAWRLPKPAEASDNIEVLPGDAYQASLFAFPEIWAPIAKTYGDRLLVAVPGAHFMLFTRGDTDAAIGALNKMAAALMQSEERPLSAAVYRWTSTGWVTTQ